MKSKGIPYGWEMVCLGEIAQVKGGTGFPLDRQGRRQGEYPFIKVSDMNLEGNHTRIHYANNYVGPEDVVSLRAAVFAPGTIVFPKVGAAIATNKKRVLTVPTLIDNNMVGITVAEVSVCDGSFLYHWFQSMDLSQFANVSAVPSITGARLKREQIPLPPIQEQQAIAEVLDAIDDAIQCTDEIIAATERLREALLHDLLTKGLPGWHSEWREHPILGIIPAGWEAIRLREGARLASGKAPCYAPDDSGAVSVMGANGRIGSTDRSNAVRGIAVGRVGASGSVRRIVSPVWLSDNVLLVEPRSDAWSDAFLYRALLRARLPRLATQTAQPLITQTDLGNIRLPLPPPLEQRGITEVLDGIDSTIEQTGRERAALAALKESVSDALLTGRVRVPVRT